MLCLVAPDGGREGGREGGGGLELFAHTFEEVGMFLVECRVQKGLMCGVHVVAQSLPGTLPPQPNTRYAPKPAPPPPPPPPPPPFPSGGPPPGGAWGCGGGK